MMSDTTTDWVSHITQQLNATKKALRGAIDGENVITRLTEAEAIILERDAFEIISILRSRRNEFAPISRIPPEILSILPDFLESREKDQTLVALTHVCRAWRKIFISRPSLWADLCPRDTEKTLTYLERSKITPVNVTIWRNGGLSPQDPFLQVIPRIAGRLKSLSLNVDPEYLNDIAPHLSTPEPLLENLDIGTYITDSDQVITPLPPILGGDLTALRNLELWCVNTELPWRKMANLTSFSLGLASSGISSITQLLDFLEDAPGLREIRLTSLTLASDGQGGRLVSLQSLETMKINESGSCAPLLSYLLIPVGAKLEIKPEMFDLGYDDYLPKSLDNLRNLSNLTEADLKFNLSDSQLQFSGPNGELSVGFRVHRVDISMALDHMARLGCSTIERLSIAGGGPPEPRVIHRVFLSMQNLRILTLCRCEGQYALVHFLSPRPPGLLVFPKLEELALRPGKTEEKLAIQSLITMAASRASAGTRLASVRILKGRDKFDREDVAELEEHVPHVVFDSEAA